MPRYTCTTIFNHRETNKPDKNARKTDLPGKQEMNR